MMNKLLILFIGLSFFSANTYAQYTEAPEEEISLNMNDYQATAHEIIHIEGAPFHQLTFENKTSKEEYLFAANFAGNVAVGFKFMYSNWDKEQHFLAGYGIANVSNGLFQLLLPKDMKHRVLVSTLLGFGMSVLAGATKEIYDAQNPKTHTADINDFLATSAGGALGTLTLKFDLRKALYGTY